MKKLLFAALIATTATQAHAQSRNNGPVMVEVIGTGSVEINASSMSFGISYSGKGATSAAAEAARDRKEAEVLRLLAADGVPATAITPLSASEQMKLSLTSMVDTMGDASMEDQATAAAPAEEASGGRMVQVATLDQANALTTKLKAVGVQVGEPTPAFDNVPAARRDARLAALRDARVGADRYAAALGMKVDGVRRVSEAGNMVLPGFQEKLGTMLATGSPALMGQMMEPPKQTIKVEESVVVDFAMGR